MKEILNSVLTGGGKLSFAPLTTKYYLKIEKYFLVAMIFTISIFNPKGVFGQCDLNAAFEQPATSGTITFPFSLTIVNGSTGSITNYVWSINGNNVSTAGVLNYTINTSGLYHVCLTISNSVCSDVYCKDIPLGYNCQEYCNQIIPNGAFNEIFSPAVPGTIESSNFFDNDVCGWLSGQITPYYCAYTDSYIAVRIGGNNQIERAETEQELSLSSGNYYQLSFRYSVQRLNFNQNGTDNIYPTGPGSIFANLGSTSIGQILSPLYNLPSSSYNENDYLQTDYDCFPTEDIQWEYVTFEPFLYTSGNKILSLSGSQGISSANAAVVFFDDICMTGYTVCENDPFFTFTTNGCSRTFSVTIPSGQSAASSYDWDFGDGTSDSGTSVTHQYLYPGTFNVCVTSICNQGSRTFCKKVTVSATDCPLTNCNSLSAITVQKCSEEGNPTYIGTINVTVPKGYKPCPGSNFFMHSSNTIAKVNSYHVTSFNSSSDIVTISINLTPASGSSFPGTASTLSFTLCNNGTVQCYTLTANGSSCSSCDIIEVSMTCVPGSSLSAPFDYQGTVSGLPSGTPSQTLSTQSGFTLSGNTIQISSTNPNLTSATALLVYGTDPNTDCYKLKIRIDLCPPLPPTCVESWAPKNFECESTSSNPVIFNISNMTVPNSGYVICGDGLVGSIDGGGTVEVNSSSIVGTDFNFDLTVTMPAGTYDGSQLYELRLYLCDNNGDVVCFYFPLRLYCEEVDPRARVDDAFKVSPNPSFDQLTLEMPKSKGLNEILDIELLNTTGKSVFKTITNENILVVDTKKLDAGIYFIIVSKNNERLYQEKVILIK